MVLDARRANSVIWAGGVANASRIASSGQVVPLQLLSLGILACFRSLASIHKPKWFPDSGEPHPAAGFRRQWVPKMEQMRRSEGGGPGWRPLRRLAVRFIRRISTASWRRYMSAAGRAISAAGRATGALFYVWAKMSVSGQPARSRRARVGRNSKQALASSVRFSRASMASSFALRACRCSTSEAA